MDDAKSFLTSVLGTIRDRLGNPLISAFVVAWAIWNFRVLLVLFGDGDGGWLAKIDYLDKKLMVPSWMWAVHGLLIPLLIASAWIFVFPSLLRKVAIHHERQGNKTRGELLTVAQAAPISEEDRTKLWATLMRERKTWSQERDELYKVVDELQGKTLSVTAVAPTNDNRIKDEPFTPIEKKDGNGLFEKDVLHRAELLGIKIIQSSGESKSSRINGVWFGGHQIDWPWMMPPRELLTGLSAPVARIVQNHLFGEMDLRMLYVAKSGSRFAIDPTGGDDKDLEKVFLRQAAVDQLAELSLIMPVGNSFEINSSGRLFLAWLLRLGFSFEPPEITANVTRRP